MRRKGIKKCRMQDSEEGVATTVGTIMALLIFLSIFSLITQQYVPVWMEDNEAYHMDEAKSQFAQMKGNIDSLILNNYKNYPTYTSIKLGSEGIPMFAEETYGVISLESSWGDTDKGMNISFSHNANDYSFSASGNISINVLNRYFEQQSLIYEYGAIILKQGDDSLLRASPPISVNEVGDDRYNIQISIIDLVGDDSRHGGAGSVGVTAKLLSRSRSTFSSIDDGFTFSLDTEYPQAWANWFNESTDLSSDNITTNGNLVEIDLGPNNISEIQVTSSKVEVDIQG